MLLALLVADLAGPEWVAAITRSDHDPAGTGIAEHATALVLVPGIAAGVAAWRARARLPSASLGWWILGWTLAAVYFAGEEVSWGQHLFGWQTPEVLQAVNRQSETNLHNISSWLDRKPRAAVELWILVAGLAVPLARLGRRAAPDPARAADWFWPTIAMVPSAALFLVFRAHKWVSEASGREIVAWLSESEVREYYIALCLSLYLGSIAWRLRHPAR
jgi:hypothetical protein